MKRLVVMLIMVCLSSCELSQKPDMAPEIEAKLVDGSTFKLSELKGQYVVLEFWASWCGPCIRNMPQLVALNAKYGERVTIVSIAIERDDSRWRAITEKAGMNWKHQIVEQARVLLASAIARDFGVTDLPTTFIVTPEGRLISGMDLAQLDAFLEASMND